MTNQNTMRIGADVGGTFTDVVLIDTSGNIWTHKVPSTPPDFERAVLNAIEHLLRTTDAAGTTVSEVAHGTTVATNAVLERRGAKTALITTKGFRDVLELRRIRAPQMYDLFFEKPQALVERYLRFELTERISASGEVLITTIGVGTMAAQGGVGERRGRIYSGLHPPRLCLSPTRKRCR